MWSKYKNDGSYIKKSELIGKKIQITREPINNLFKFIMNGTEYLTYSFAVLDNFFSGVPSDQISKMLSDNPLFIVMNVSKSQSGKNYYNFDIIE